MSVVELDGDEVATWAARVAQTIDRSLAEPVRAEALAALRDGVGGTRVGLAVLAQLALLDDALRVAQLAFADDVAGVAGVDGLARVAAAKYFAVLPGYEAFADGVADRADVARFLVHHRDDAGAFGYASATPWRGLALCRTVERVTHNGAPLRDLERMLVRIMDAALADRAGDTARAARRKLREQFDPPVADGIDPRAAAFCRPDGPEVFSSVAHGSHVHEPDPFDVDTIHQEAREVFQIQLDRAATPENAQRGHGKTLLLLGDAGCGKTHLLRALRAQTHTRRLGYVGYFQMTAEVADYPRYVLRSLIDSLERPYDPPSLAESALMYLSDGLAEGRAALPPAELERLRSAELSAVELDRAVGGLVDRIVRTEGLGGLEIDLVHALLLLQRRGPALQRRGGKYLRCEGLTRHDRDLLGGLAAREQADDPLRTIRQLAMLMHELQLAALVLLVDQLEDAVPDGQPVARVQQAFDALRAIADAVPSAVIVIACIEDVYEATRARLTQSLVDRLERDPAPVRLSRQREALDIEQMLARRLEHLYGTFDVAWREDEPLFPFTRDHVAAVTKKSAREVLAKLREFHAGCIADKQIVNAQPRRQAPPPPPRPQFESFWNDAVQAAAVPEEDDEVMALVHDALRGAALEVGAKVVSHLEGEHLWVECAGQTRVIALCNHGVQGGHFGKQLERLRQVAAAGVVPVALRCSDFEFKAKSRPATQVAEFVARGGRPVVLADAELRVAAAARTLAATSPGLVEWRGLARPLAQLDFVRKILELEQPRPVVEVFVLQPPERPTPVRARPAAPSGPLPKVDPDAVRLGVTTTVRSEVVSLPLATMMRHVSVLGSSGSGKTTTALSMQEQLRQRGNSVLMVDRKGDLSSYAREAWWSDASAADHARRAALRGRIDVALYTPGNVHGRPLRLPILPLLADASPAEVDEATQTAAAALGAMMGFSESSARDRAKQAVLLTALKLHASEREVTLDLLRETIEQPDPELLRRVNTLQRHFAGLAENLDSLRLQREALLTGSGEPLDVGRLLPPPGGKPRLSIIYTGGLGDTTVQQFWVSRLLVDLDRLGRRRPSSSLQAVVFFDEADTYVPATSKPATKEAMIGLLKRSRSTGIALVLATQSPGDFDYRARDQTYSVLVGRIQDPRAIEKLRNLLASYPDVGPRLANQPMGHFFVLSDGTRREVKCDASMMRTEQVSEREIIELAAAQSRTSG